MGPGLCQPAPWIMNRRILSTVHSTAARPGRRRRPSEPRPQSGGLPPASGCDRPICCRGNSDTGKPVKGSSARDRDAGAGGRAQMSGQVYFSAGIQGHLHASGTHSQLGRTFEAKARRGAPGRVRVGTRHWQELGSAGTGRSNGAQLARRVRASGPRGLGAARGGSPSPQHNERWPHWQAVAAPQASASGPGQFKFVRTTY